MGKMTTIIRESGSPRQVYRGMKQDQAAQLKVTGEHWHGAILPKHFDNSAFNRYKLKPRTDAYTKRKLRRKGHARPLVWTGNLEKMVRGMFRLTGNRLRATVTMKGPRYLYQFRVDNVKAPIDKAEEITAMNKKDEKDLAAHMEKGMVRRMKRRTKIKETRYK